MLAGPPGRRATDGPWAPHWYGAVEKSTGFGPPETGPVELPPMTRSASPTAAALITSGWPRTASGRSTARQRGL